MRIGLWPEEENMKRVIVLCLLFLCLVGTALALPETDRAGHPIALRENPERIVSMAPSTTRVLTDLGLRERLVAIDTYSAGYQPDLSDLPQFDMMTPDMEKLAALEPDVIFITGMSLSGGSNPYQALLDLGIAVVEIPTSSSIEGILQDVAFIGECVGVSTDGLTAKFPQLLDRLKTVSGTIREKRTVAIEVSALPYICCAGGGTYLDEMITLIGAENVYHDREAWASLSEEDAVAADPDVIVTVIGYLPDPVSEILGRKGWESMKAIQSGRVFSLNEESANQPNHHIVDALIELARAVYPEYYGDLSLDSLR